MAHLFVTSMPAWGHVNPTLPLVSELIARGHRVTYAVTRDFRAVCAATGAAVVEIGPDDERPPPSPRAEPFQLSALLLDATTAFLPGILQALERDPADLLLHDSMAPWGRLAAERTGTARVCSTTTFAVHPTIFRSVSSRRQLLGLLARGLPALPRIMVRRARLRRRYGARNLAFGDLISNGGAPTLVYTAREFQPLAQLLGPEVCFVGPVVRAETVEVQPWLPPGSGPLVFASLGTVIPGRADFFRACVEAAQRGGWRLVLSVGSESLVERLGPLPASVRAFAGVPQVELLGVAAVFITHAGMNGVHEALLAEVPMVCAPQQLEQRVVAGQVEAHGLGVCVPPSPSADELRDAVGALLEDPGVAARLAAMATSLRKAGGVTRAADEIEKALESAPMRTASSSGRGWGRSAGTGARPAGKLGMRRPRRR